MCDCRIKKAPTVARDNNGQRVCSVCSELVLQELTQAVNESKYVSETVDSSEADAAVTAAQTLVAKRQAGALTVLCVEESCEV